MKRGEIWLTDFSVGVGNEVNDQPSLALIISVTEFNQCLARVVVIPLLDVIEPKSPSQITITLGAGKEQFNKTAITDRIKAVDKVRLKDFLGITSRESIEKVGLALINYLMPSHFEIMGTLADPVEKPQIKSVVNKLFDGPLF